MEKEVELKFYSTEVCWSCHYEIKKNHPEDWYKKTGCPNCQRSFVD